MKRVLVTGATGFIGACLARRLLGDSHEVHLLVRPTHDPWRIADITKHVRVFAVDFQDSSALRQAIAEARADWIFHLAVHGAYPDQTNVQQMVRDNIAGTAAVLDEAVKRGFEVFVNAGSSSEYGFHAGATREDDRLDPNSMYAVTKASATMLCRYVARATQTQIRTLRLYSIYGPYEEPIRLLPRLLMAARRRRLPPLADPRTARDFVYVDDAVAAFIAAATARVDEPGAVFNICSGIQTTLYELVELCRTEFAVQEMPEWGTQTSRTWDTTTWVGDPAKAAEHLGWSPKTDLRTGVRLFFDWLGRDDVLPRYLPAAS